eukprot:3172022-Pleurochrysis_carterae.AAC.5
MGQRGRARRDRRALERCPPRLGLLCTRGVRLLRACLALNRLLRLPLRSALSEPQPSDERAQSLHL